jgi:nucleotide-binding universal stress UspA family protein
LNLSKSLQRIEEEKIHLIKTKVEDYFKKSGLLEKVTFKTNRGSLVDSCQELENSAVGIDLLLLGKRGENASFATEHLGANLERVVRASGRPCWIANKEYVDIKKLALAYDDSESARHALQFLIRSPLFKSLAIDLVYVSDEAAISEEAKMMLNQAEKTLKDNGYNSVNVVCLQDDVCDGIAGHVVNQAIDLLIMGAYGHSAIRHLLIGSTTTELMRRCKISVLLFR